MRVEFLSPANLDYVKAVDFYESERPGLGLEFIEDLERTVVFIGRFPSLGSPAPQNTRRVRLHTFPYALVYQVRRDTIWIVAVEHHSRQPGFWRDRA